MSMPTNTCCFPLIWLFATHRLHGFNLKPIWTNVFVNKSYHNSADWTQPYWHVSKRNLARQWDSQIETETRKLRETKTVNLLTFQTGKVVGLRLDCTDREFSRQCVEDAMYANKHNQTSGQRWLERQRKRRRWRYNEVRRRCTMTTEEERRNVKAEGLVDGFPTRNCLQGSRWKPADAKRQSDS